MCGACNLFCSSVPDFFSIPYMLFFDINPYLWVAISLLVFNFSVSWDERPSIFPLSVCHCTLGVSLSRKFQLYSTLLSMGRLSKKPISPAFCHLLPCSLVSDITFPLTSKHLRSWFFFTQVIFWLQCSASPFLLGRKVFWCLEFKLKASVQGSWWHGSAPPLSEINVFLTHWQREVSSLWLARCLSRGSLTHFPWALGNPYDCCVEVSNHTGCLFLPLT